MTLTLNYTKTETAHAPTRANDTDAGIDLYLDGDHHLYPGHVVTLHTGIAVAIPEGHVGILAERSSLHKQGVSLVNKVGIIDAGYRGEILAKVTATTDGPITLKDQAKVVQLVIVPIPQLALEEVDELDDTERGTGGFGSTGL